MENTTKALIIAAAILIAIVLISLGVFVLGQGTTMVKENSDMSATEITSFNSKFEPYLGENVSGTKVKQLIKIVNQNNRQYADEDDERIINFVGNATKPSTGEWINLGNDPTNYKESGISTSKSYVLKVIYYTSAGLISDIDIDFKR